MTLGVQIKSQVLNFKAKTPVDAFDLRFQGFDINIS